MDNSIENVKVAIKVAEENMEDAIVVREQLLKQGEDSLATLRTVHEDLKKAMALNIDLRIKMWSSSWRSTARAGIHLSFARKPWWRRRQPSTRRSRAPRQRQPLNNFMFFV